MMAPSEMGAADPIATWLSILVTIGFACFGILLALKAFKSTIK